MKVATLAIALATVSACAQSAQARSVYHHRHYVARFVHHRAVRAAFDVPHWEVAAPGDFWNANRTRPVPARGVGGRPSAWCGWEMRQLVGSDPGPEYNLARNWAHWGHAGPVGVGAVVVWPHHVAKIVGREGGQWIIESGNDGNRLRTRPHSLAGVVAVRWG